MLLPTIPLFVKVLFFYPNSKVKSTINEDDDAYIRAMNWREKNRNLGLPAELNPLIAYTSTSDLSTIIEELSSSMDPSWLEIAKLIQKISPIRDSVMHNQVIDEKALQNLFHLQTKVYAALNRSVSPIE